MINELDLVKKIDKRLPVSKAHGAHLTMGQRVAAMIINGLGFLNDRLYLHSQFFEEKAVARLLGKEVRAEHLNDDALARALDAIHEYGVTRLCSALGFEIAKERGLFDQTARLNSTSLSLYGDYESAEAELQVTHG